MDRQNIKSSEIRVCEFKTQPLFFMHIPKTAGITFRTVLENHFDANQICPAYYGNELIKIPIDMLAQFRLFRGHISLGEMNDAMPIKSIHCITVLRDPVEYTISHFEHLKRDKSGVAPKKLYERVRSMSFEDFIRSVDHDIYAHHLFKNLQTRYLITDQNLRYESIDNRGLQMAKEELSHFAFFGLLEEFKKSIQLICHTFGWHPSVPFYTLNAAPHRPHSQQLSSGALKAIKTNMAYDIELYQFAKTLFFKRYTRMVEELFAENGPVTGAMEHRFDPLSSKHIVKRLKANYDNQFKDIQPSDKLTIQFQQAINGSGWYPPKTDAAGRTFRWTGPNKNSTLDIPLTTNDDLTVQFRIIKAMSFEILKSLSLRINGQPVELSLSIGQNSTSIFEGRIPRSILFKNQHVSELVFHVQQTLRPTNWGEILSSDVTSLPHGLAFEWLKIFPFEKRTGQKKTIRVSMNQLEQRHVKDIEIFVSIWKADPKRFKNVNIEPHQAGNSLIGFFDHCRPIAQNLIHCAGWALNLKTRTPAKRVLIVNQHHDILAEATVDRERGDVAKNFSDLRLLNSGWSVCFKRHRLKYGPNKIFAFAFGENGQAVRLPNDHYWINLKASDYVNHLKAGAGELLTNRSSETDEAITIHGWIAAPNRSEPQIEVFVINHEKTVLNCIKVKTARSQAQRTPWKMSILKKHLYPGNNIIKAYVFLPDVEKAIRLHGHLMIKQVRITDVIERPIHYFGYLDRAETGAQGRTLVLSGWAIDATMQIPAGEVIVTLETIEENTEKENQGRSKLPDAIENPGFREGGRRIIAHVDVGGNRDDIVASYQSEVLRMCGWSAHIDWPSIGVKRGVVKAYAYFPKETRAVRLNHAFFISSTEDLLKTIKIDKSNDII